MLYREIIAVYSELHTEHINTMCGQNVEFVNVKPSDAQYSVVTDKGINITFISKKENLNVRTVSM